MGLQSSNCRDYITQQSRQSQTQEIEQVIQQKSCLFFTFRKKIKRKLIWQNNFLKNLELIDQCNQNSWIIQVHKQVQKQHERIKFLKQMNHLRLESQQCKQDKENKELLTHQEFYEFKNNLNKSILLSDPFLKSKQSNENLNDVHHSQAIQMTTRYSNSPTQKKLTNNRYDTFRVKHQLAGSKVNIISKLKVTEIFNMSKISFLDEKEQYRIIQDSQLKKQNASTLRIYIKFTTILENHFNNTTCVLNVLQRVFIKYIIKNHEKAMALYQKQQLKKKKTTIQRELTSMVQQIKKYVKLMTKTVYDYYYLKQFTKQHCKNTLITCFDNLQAAITSILFKNVQFYLVIFEMVSLYNKSREEHISKKIKQFGQITPQLFEVDVQYCLNNNTLKKAKYEESLSVGSKIENFEFQNVINQQNNLKMPYIECIKSLQKLNKTKSPITKMKIITDCSEQLTQSIYKFYKQNNMKLQDQAVNADQILSIYCYIIAKSNVTNLLSHLYILENFSTSYQEMSAAGYYWTVMICAIQKIQEGTQQSIDNQIAISF